MSFEIDRRNLLRGAAVLGAAVALESCKKDDDTAEKGGAPAREQRRASSQAATLLVLTAVAERILPSDGQGPGAREANVGGFLKTALHDERLAHLRPLLQRGAAFLDEAAQVETAKQERKATSFTDLDDAQRDSLLDRLASRKMRPNDFDGTAFLRIMVALTLEGFLGDPKHGGNKDGAAWAWLGFDPNGRNAIAHASAHGSPTMPLAPGGERP